MGQSFDDLLEFMPDIAKAVNEFDNEAAQQRALDALLNAFFGRELEVPPSLDGAEKDKPPAPSGSTGAQEEVGRRPDWEQKLIEGMPDGSVVAGKKTNRDAQAMWALLALQQRGEKATTSAILGVIKNELGIGPERRNNLSDRLKGWTPTYVTREKDGRGYVYAPTIRSLDVFKGLGDE